MSDVGKRIREIRRGKRLQQGEAAERIGIGRTALYRYEKGMVDPTATMLERIAEGLGVSVAELFRDPDAVEAGGNPLVESTYTSDDAAEDFAATIRRFAERARVDLRWARAYAPQSLDDLEILDRHNRNTYANFMAEAQGEQGYPPTFVDKPVVFAALEEYSDVLDAIQATYEEMAGDRSARHIGEQKDPA